MPTSFNFTSATDFQLSGKVIESKPATRNEPVFDMDVSYFEHEVIFQQRVKVFRSPAFVLGSVKFMVCNDHQCLPPETVSFSIPVK